MITKMDARKIDHKPNIGTIVLDYNNLIDNKSKQNYENQFKINQMWIGRWNLKTKKLFDIVIKPDPADQPWNLLTWLLT
jgi:hypothetical protein